MPELPEVETICQELKSILISKKIISAQVNRRDLRVPIANNFHHIIKEVTPTDVYRKGKYVIIAIKEDGKFNLIFHMGMTGALLYNSPAQAHDHIILNLENNNTLTFNDPRRFGLAIISYNINDFLTNLGPDPLDESYSGVDLFQSLRNRTAEIKNILLNGKIIAGIGNIYASEVLFEAKISPFRKAYSLTKVECSVLTTAIKRVLNKAIQANGTTFSNYRTPLNSKGSFHEQLKVYQQAQCKICGDPISKSRFGGRNTFYCVVCQDVCEN